ncbi:MAG: MFS transporter, partial [Candidatus Neomarinimicrobiota bacterium]
MSLRTVLTITFLGHLLNHSLTLLYPVVMIQLASLHPQVSLTTFGLLGTGHYLLYGLGAFPAGWLTDRFGARKILLIYLLGSGVAVALLVVSRGLVQLALGLALLGLFASLYHPAGLTLISHTSPRISRHLGLHGIAGSLGLALGPLVGGATAGWLGWRAPYILFGILAVMAGAYLLLAAGARPQAAPEERAQERRPTRGWPLAFVYIIGIFMGLAHRGTLSFMPLHFSMLFEGRLAPVMVGGFLTALVLASGILGQIMGGILGDRYRRNRVLVYVVLLNVPLLLLMSSLTSLLLVGVAVLWGVANFAYQPVANALVSDFS